MFSNMMIYRTKPYLLIQLTTMVSLKGFIVLTIAFVAVNCVEHYQLDRESIEKEWNAYKVKYNLQFNVDEESERFEAFSFNLRRIEQHNSEYENQNVSYYLGVTQFTHWTSEEFAKSRGFIMPEEFSDVEQYEYLPRLSVPRSFDWRQHGAVTPIKNQGQCHSCWIFCSIAALETVNKIKTKKLVSLSEQQVLDCAKASQGCHTGGTVPNALEYVKNNGGVMAASSYPYTARQGRCRFDRSKISGKCTGYKVVPKNEKVMQQALLSGPLIVAIAAPDDFSEYKGGLYMSEACANNNINHGVTIVGYGTTGGGEDYWIVKNSWGTTWGDRGYGYMKRNMNICRITELVVQPTL